MGSSRLLEQLSQIGQKVPQNKVAKVITVLLVLYSAYLVATTVWKFAPGLDHAGVISAPVISINKATTSTNATDLSSLYALNLFGKEEVRKEVPKPKPVTSVAPKTRLNITLTGIVADNTSNVSDTSVAIIESGREQDTYGIGQQISGTSARVSQILLDRVILSVGSRYETLMLEGIEYSTSIPGSSDELNDNIDVDAIVVGPKRPTTRQRNTKPSYKELDEPAELTIDRSDDSELTESLREQREQLFEDPKQLLDFIQISPYREDGELIGYRLMPGKDSSLFLQAGLKHNDLAVNINGYDLTDMQQALTLMGELQQLTEVDITVIRDDSPVQIILAL